MVTQIKNQLYFLYFIVWLVLGISLIVALPIAYAQENIQEFSKNQLPKQQIKESEQTIPLEAKIGIFINDLYDFNLRKQSYNVVFWAWFVYPATDNYKPEKSSEVVNAYGYTKNDFFSALKKNNLYWSSMKFVGQVTHQWEVANFPFDSQKLQIILEDMELDSSMLQYVADKENSKISSNINLPDWKVIDFDIQIVPFVYPTTYGDPEVRGGKRTYSRAIVSIILERESTIKLFFNMFLALYVAFILSALAFLVPISNSASRLSLATGSVFAVVANKYASDTLLPLTTYITLVDKLQIVTLIFISISALISVILIHLDSQHKTSARVVNKIGGISFLVTYVLLNIYWVYQALYSS